MNNHLSKEVVQHLQNAKALIATKVESWRGREPFPGDAEKMYRQMLADVGFELHDYEVVATQPPMTPHLKAVLDQYRTLLDDTILFWTPLDGAVAATYESIMKNLDQILGATEVQPGSPVPSITKRPNVRCVEHGRCKVKVVMDESRGDSPTQDSRGMWVFGDPEVYRQNRECMTCGRAWTTSYNRSQSATAEVVAPVRIML